jgi:hypothetical protein
MQPSAAPARSSFQGLTARELDDVGGRATDDRAALDELARDLEECRGLCAAAWRAEAAKTCRAAASDLGDFVECLSAERDRLAKIAVTKDDQVTVTAAAAAGKSGVLTFPLPWVAHVAAAIHDANLRKIGETEPRRFAQTSENVRSFCMTQARAAIAATATAVKVLRVDPAALPPASASAPAPAPGSTPTEEASHD